jgi:hypothetical protein
MERTMTVTPQLTPRPLTAAERKQWLADLDTQFASRFITRKEWESMRGQVEAMPAGEA